MKYAIQINSGPGSSPAAQSAYQCIKALLAEGHEIVRVFFYHAGVYHGLDGESPHRERIAPDWPSLARSHGLDLVFCASAAERRGMMPSGAGPMNPAEGFRCGGLGQWLEACIEADRVLVFG